jgi:hypothetical protein
MPITVLMNGVINARKRNEKIPLVIKARGISISTTIAQP